MSSKKTSFPGRRRAPELGCCVLKHGRIRAWTAMMETLGGGRFVKGICVAFYGVFLAGLRYFMAFLRIFWHFVASNGLPAPALE